MKINNLTAVAVFVVAAVLNVAVALGQDWSPLGSGMNDEVTNFAIYDNKLVAGGSFTTAGGVGANRIATWNGSV